MSKSANKRVAAVPAAPIMSSEEPSADSGAGLLRQGWVSLALWLAFGILLEGFNAFRSPAYMDDTVRRDMFRLAHAHGTLMNIVLLVAAICVRIDLIRLTRMTSLGLRSSILLLPSGFLLGGIWHFKNEPGLGIFLVPVGAVILLATAVHISFSLPRR
jgi:hypothetical protein